MLDVDGTEGFLRAVGWVNVLGIEVTLLEVEEL
jgi:hypothetical protein